MLEPIAPLMPVASADEAGFLSASPVQPAGQGFGDWFTKELGTVNDKLIDAHLAAQRVATGSNESLHEVMIQMQDARMSFEMLAQVRNRVLEAYQEVMRMQV
jgi:flagellar hook-basal body complex protein FliE